VVAVWGPAGAPGRTTVATNVAAELARRRVEVVLADLDPYGGAVAQHLGILDEVSGLLSAARLAAADQLDDRFATVCRGVGDHLAVVTGLPRADRWREVRPAQVERLVERARTHGHVVLDTGFCLEDDAGSDFGGRPARNALTLTALEQADEVVVVGAADPVGLARLARGLVDLRELSGTAPVRVVVNRMRASIGWSEKEIAGMVEGFTRVAGLHFLPEDRTCLDRALVAGLPVGEVGASALSHGLAALVDALFPGSADGVPGRRKRGVPRRSR
jgi:MinD-like ATPase involved in chromosome partitioning or flagellar assembly